MAGHPASNISASRMRRWCVPALLHLPGMGCTTNPGESPVRIYAAASTTNALQEALATFDSRGRPAPEAIVGASSAMARQIQHGAPADLFLSANPDWMQHLIEAGNIGADTRIDLLENSLVVVAPKNSTSALDPTRPGAFTALLADGRLAMGDPDHVPAGVYAKASLTALGSWSTVEPRLARTSDVRAALALVERAEVPAGIVYATDAAASQEVEVIATLPASSHPPVVYPLAIVRTHAESPGVQALYDHLQGEAAARVFETHGFRRK